MERNDVRMPRTFVDLMLTIHHTLHLVLGEYRGTIVIGSRAESIWGR